MNLLIDFLTARLRHGSGEWHRRVVLTLLERISQQQLPVNLYALYDSALGIAYEELCPEQLTIQYNISFLDIQKQSIEEYIQQYHIDRFFVACAQRLGETPGFTDVTCPVICVIHDLAFEEQFYNHLNEYIPLPAPVERTGVQLTRYWRVRQSFLQFLREFKYWITRLPYRTDEENLLFMRNVVKVLQSHTDSIYVTVSYHTKVSMMYNFGIPDDKIKVFYSPERIEVPSQPIQNAALKKLIDEGKRFFLLLSADRPHKNGRKAIAAFHRYVRLHPNVCLVTSSYGASAHDNHIDLDFLSDSDLDHAFRHCYALIYPSYFEGFGYPPLEAMKYGKPVLSSNTTSLPEVLGDAAIYFSPLYETAIFEALLKLTDDNYYTYCEMSRNRYQQMKAKQESDLQELLSLILKS